jgi:hypothetical protein
MIEEFNIVIIVICWSSRQIYVLFDETSRNEFIDKLLQIIHLTPLEKKQVKFTLLMRETSMYKSAFKISSTHPQGTQTKKTKRVLMCFFFFIFRMYKKKMGFSCFKNKKKK